MGYHTRFTGEVTVTPPLNAQELSYLTRFGESRRMHRTKGPYYVGGGGFMGQAKEPDILDYNRSPEGQPGLWCHWLPSADGTRIAVDEESEKFYDADVWLLYLIDTFLRTGATVARELGDPVPGREYPEEFGSFTFDHVLRGTIEAEGEFADDVWRLIVRDNLVLYQDGVRDRDGRVTYPGPQVLVTATGGRPPM